MMSARPTASLNGLVASNGRLDVEALLDLCAVPCTDDTRNCSTLNCYQDTCNLDTGFCEYTPLAECCGDDVCTATEDSSGSCPSDCK